jgi:hypothetical protein
MASERYNEITGEMVKDRPRVPVTVHDIDMPFWSLVVFLVKLAFAAIPAAIIVTVVVVVVTAIVGGAIGSFGNRQGSAPIRRSGTTDICYDRSYEIWEGLAGYTEFPSLASCLASGGKPPPSTRTQ